MLYESLLLHFRSLNMCNIEIFTKLFISIHKDRMITFSIMHEQHTHQRWAEITENYHKGIPSLRMSFIKTYCP